MVEIEKNECKKIIGGTSLTGTIVSALKGYINAVLGIGQVVGSAIRRITSRNYCGI